MAGHRRGRLTLGKIDRPKLRSLRIETGGLRAHALESIAAAAWPELTQRYVREAENLRAGFGDVFPPLPASLFGTTKEFRSGSGFHQNSTDSFGPISPGYWRGGRDSKPNQESSEASTEAARAPGKTVVAGLAKSAEQSTVLVGESTVVAERNDADAAVRAAAKAAIDAGNFTRAAALLAILQEETETTTVVDARKRFGRR